MAEYTPPPSYTPGPAKPGKVQAIAIMVLINGILNILWALGASAGALFSLIGIFCVPITILPGVLGIFEILYASNLLSITPKPNQNGQTIAILEIACILAGNVVSLVVGILVLVFASDPEVKDWFARLGTA